MKKSIRIFLIILVIVSLISVIFPTVPPHSWYSKYILTNSSILSKLGLNQNQCSYQKAVILIEARPASISCLTTDRYKHNSDEKIKAINEMRNILENNGWKLSTKSIIKEWDVTYNKGMREIRIYPYDWEGYQLEKVKLIITLR